MTRKTKTKSKSNIECNIDTATDTITDMGNITETNNVEENIDIDVDINIDDDDEVITVNGLTIDNSTSQQSEPVKRKRGRPRKNQIIDVVDKKKGKRNKVERHTAKLFEKPEYEDEIILHLPLTFSDIKKAVAIDKNVDVNIDDNSSDEENDDDNDIGITDNLTDIVQPYTDISPNTNENKNIFRVNDTSSSSSDENNSSDTNGSDMNNQQKKEFLRELKEKEESILKLKDELENYKKLLEENDIIGINAHTLKKLNLELINTIDSKPVIAEKTNIACWWCTYNFDTMPCFVPEKFVDNKFYVFGCFCSFGCAAAYNIYKEDYKTWDRHSLIKRLYNTMMDTKEDEDVPLAAPREALKKFGGYMSIDEFRKNTQILRKEYRLIVPPMVSVVLSVEETNTHAKGFQQSNTKTLSLYRNIPIPSNKQSIVNTKTVQPKTSKMKARQFTT